MTDVSEKLLERNRDRAYVARMEKMEAAWREWRSEIVKAMAVRVEAIGTGKDDELSALQAEIVHADHVLRALHAHPDCIGTHECDDAPQDQP
jgi:hypothetical protein